MSHLHELAAALADGELDHDARDRAFAHLAGCAQCRADVDVQRRMKSLLANQPDPAPSAELLARLSAVTAGPWSTERDTAGAAPRSRRARRRAGRVRSARAPRLTRPRAAAGAVTVVGAALGLAVLVGDGDPGRRVTPPLRTFLDQHTDTTSRVPLEDPASTVVLTSFSDR
jgi:anti-sigma factor RsiW